MEFEFDKEIDAILRKARGGETALAGGDFKFQISGSEAFHLDADTIVAFAENALPEKSKKLYTLHFAECDRCRRILSNLILLNAETESVPAFVSAAENSAEISAPWYRRLFAMPNLAYATGAAVLVFGGFLGVLVLQNLDNTQNAVSQVGETQSAAPARGPNAAQDSGFSDNTSNATTSNAATMTANTASSAAVNTAANTAAVSTNSSAAMSNAAGTSSQNFSTNSAAAPRDRIADAEENQSRDAPTVSASPPPAPILSEAEPENKDDQKSDKRKETADAVTAAPAPKKRATPKPKAVNENADAGLARSGAAESRRVGGKTFRRTDSVWIDTAYRQGTPLTQISRGSNEYKKLDREVRNIAENLDGAVIIVWKSKAYRIR